MGLILVKKKNESRCVELLRDSCCQGKFNARDDCLLAKNIDASRQGSLLPQHECMALFPLQKYRYILQTKKKTQNASTGFEISVNISKLDCRGDDYQ